VNPNVLPAQGLGEHEVKIKEVFQTEDGLSCLRVSPDHFVDRSIMAQLH
jgi:hypothetical protein